MAELSTLTALPKRQKSGVVSSASRVQDGLIEGGDAEVARQHDELSEALSVIESDYQVAVAKVAVAKVAVAKVAVAKALESGMEDHGVEGHVDVDTARAG